jgi:hypothetical protein
MMHNSCSPHSDFVRPLVLDLLGLASTLFHFLVCVYQSQQLRLLTLNPAQIPRSAAALLGVLLLCFLTSLEVPAAELIF